MNKFTFGLGILLCLIFPNKGNAQYFTLQDNSRDPLGALPMQFNSSFAGEGKHPRINSSFLFSRAVFVLPPNQYSLITSFDSFISPIGTGVGVTMGQGGDFGQSTFLDSHRFICLAAAPKFSIKGKFTISPSLDYTFQTTVTKVDEDFLNNLPFSIPNLEGNRNLQQSRLGLLINTRKFYLGYSNIFYNKMTSDNPHELLNYTSYFSNSYIQAGYTYQRSSESKLSITPQILFIWAHYDVGHTPPFRLKAFNLNFKYEKYIFGINNAGLHVGLQNSKARVMLTGMADSGYFLSNLSFRYIFK
jgi:hypothetical protein